MPRGIYPHGPRPDKRTPDVCRICAVALSDTNWRECRRKSSHKVCDECVRLTTRVRYAEDPVFKQSKKDNATRHYYEVKKAKFQALRVEAVTAYGGKCACCGEATIAFLAIDHVRNNGAAHRKEIGQGSYAIYRWLKDREWPKEGFQVLCCNCNFAKWSQGICPHETQLRLVPKGS